MDPVSASSRMPLNDSASDFQDLVDPSRLSNTIQVSPLAETNTRHNSALNPLARSISVALQGLDQNTALDFLKPLIDSLQNATLDDSDTGCHPSEPFAVQGWNVNKLRGSRGADRNTFNVCHRPNLHTHFITVYIGAIPFIPG